MWVIGENAGLIKSNNMRGQLMDRHKSLGGERGGGQRGLVGLVGKRQQQRTGVAPAVGLR